MHFVFCSHDDTLWLNFASCRNSELSGFSWSNLVAGSVAFVAAAAAAPTAATLEF